MKSKRKWKRRNFKTCSCSSRLRSPTVNCSSSSRISGRMLVFLLFTQSRYWRSTTLKQRNLWLNFIPFFKSLPTKFWTSFTIQILIASNWDKRHRRISKCSNAKRKKNFEPRKHYKMEPSLKWGKSMMLCLNRNRKPSMTVGAKLTKSNQLN